MSYQYCFGSCLINDSIDPTPFSLSYVTVDDVADLVAQLGQGSLLAKTDIESAYWLVPVHPKDQPLQAVKWRNQIFIDPMLPFGLRSAPKIFTTLADALQWYSHQRGVPHIMHYLDDFILYSGGTTRFITVPELTHHPRSGV